jgi:hypothetical protein
MRTPHFPDKCANKIPFSVAGITFIYFLGVLGSDQSAIRINALTGAVSLLATLCERNMVVILMVTQTHGPGSDFDGRHSWPGIRNMGRDTVERTASLIIRIQPVTYLPTYSSA